MMAYYANAKGNIPFHKREEERRWQDHLKKHQNKLKKVKSTVPDKGEEYQHMKVKLKRLQLQEDRLAQIEYENRKLLERIQRAERKQRINTWNEHYTPRDQSKRQTPRSVVEPSDDESYTSSSEDESETTSRRDYDSMTDTMTETPSEIMGGVREKEKKKIDEENEKIKKHMESQRPQHSRESTADFMQRTGVHESSGGNSMIIENDNLNKRLVYMLKMNPNTKIAGEPEDKRLERQHILEEARAAVKRENELLKNNGTSKSNQNENEKPANYDDRVVENMRLNRKIKEIKAGRGKPSIKEPTYNSHDRWWVTSPRGRDKAMYEEEKKKLIEDIKKRRIQQKRDKAKEEREILKQKEDEKKQQNIAPEGYRRKMKKRRKSTAVNKKEILPDTSFIDKDPYQDLPPLVDDDDDSKSEE